MKKLLIILVFAITYNAKAQVKVDTLSHKNGYLIYTEIKTEPDKNLNTLYNAAKLWLLDKANAKKTVLVDDAYQGQIIAKGSFQTYKPDETQTTPPYKSIIYDFKIQIDCKDGKYRVQITDIYYKEAGSNYPAVMVDWDYRSATPADRKIAYHLDGRFKDLLSSLAAKMDGIATNDF